MLYAKAPGHAFSRRQYLIIVIANTSVVWFVALWAVVNAAAANADLCITAVVLRYPAAAQIVDEMDGFRVLLPRSARLDNTENHPAELHL
jgi:hypothetical protein